MKPAYKNRMLKGMVCSFGPAAIGYGKLVGRK